jgi:hypothetical protein
MSSTNPSHDQAPKPTQQRNLQETQRQRQQQQQPKQNSNHDSKRTITNRTKRALPNPRSSGRIKRKQQALKG